MVEISQPEGDFLVTHELMDREEVVSDTEPQSHSTRTLVSSCKERRFVLCSWIDDSVHLRKRCSRSLTGSLQIGQLAGLRPIRLLRLLHNYLSLFGDAFSSLGKQVLGITPTAYPVELNSLTNPPAVLGPFAASFSLYAPRHFIKLQA